MTDKEILDNLEMSAHQQGEVTIDRLRVTKDWTYEVIHNDKTYKGKNIREALINFFNKKED